MHSLRVCDSTQEDDNGDSLKRLRSRTFSFIKHDIVEFFEYKNGS